MAERAATMLWYDEMVAAGRSKSLTTGNISRTHRHLLTSDVGWQQFMRYWGAPALETPVNCHSELMEDQLRNIEPVTVHPFWTDLWHILIKLNVSVGYWYSHQTRINRDLELGVNYAHWFCWLRNNFMSCFMLVFVRYHKLLKFVIVGLLQHTVNYFSFWVLIKYFARKLYCRKQCMQLSI